MALKLSDNDPKILEFIKSHSVGVLATADKEALPHAATIYFISEQGSLIYFLTKQGTTKHRNLQENPVAALAVSDTPSQTTVQITGAARQVKDPEAIESLLEKITAVAQMTNGGQQPPVTKLDAGEYVAYCLEPKTIRMSEFIRDGHAATVGIFEELAGNTQ